MSEVMIAEVMVVVVVEQGFTSNTCNVIAPLSEAFRSTEATWSRTKIPCTIVYRLQMLKGSGYYGGLTLHPSSSLTLYTLLSQHMIYTVKVALSAGNWPWKHQVHTAPVEAWSPWSKQCGMPGHPSGHGAGTPAHYRRVPTDLKAGSLSTAPPMPRKRKRVSSGVTVKGV
ncbi:hypothetical protein PoB_002551800 [Plakobranchus ocellatus]|uniref:Fibronectin type-III domain-containing protein n=1 Tax=Plakobranchus ocellatus TaxID=259542 RepID=A0AAV3ZX47_9GAST|nr:hypothetical protein PoB_002551800 [Plakobranchus ocellatus]